MSAQNNTEIDAYELVALAAHLMSRQSSPVNAVETAFELIQQAETKLEEVSLRAALETPQAQAAWDKQQAEWLAEKRLSYEKGVKTITGITRFDRALPRFKEFLRWKAKTQESTPEGYSVNR